MQMTFDKEEATAIIELLEKHQPEKKHLIGRLKLQYKKRWPDIPKNIGPDFDQPRGKKNVSFGINFR